MTTKTLMSKYADTLSAFEADAANALKTAQANVVKREMESGEARSELNQIKDVMKENHHGFWGAPEAILGMMYKRPESPEEIEKALEPVVGYQVAMSAVPAAEESLKEAEEAEAAARGESERANELYLAIKTLQKMGEAL